MICIPLFLSYFLIQERKYKSNAEGILPITIRKIISCIIFSNLMPTIQNNLYSILSFLSCFCLQERKYTEHLPLPQKSVFFRGVTHDLYTIVSLLFLYTREKIYKEIFTPFGTFSPQSASSLSLITAHFVGVLNVQRCKTPQRKNGHFTSPFLFSRFYTFFWFSRFYTFFWFRLFTHHTLPAPAPHHQSHQTQHC